MTTPTTTPETTAIQPTSGTSQVPYDLDDAVRARTEILRIADPQDAYVSALIELFGPLTCADYLTGRHRLTADTLGQALETAGVEPDAVTAGLLEAIEHRIERWKTRRDAISAEQDARFAHLTGAWLVVPEDPLWPAALNDLGTNAPYGLWGRGDYYLLEELAQRPSVAVVGSRDVTAYGNSATAHIAGTLAEQGTCVISGGAFGVDAAAHRVALATATGNLPTIALMAGGVDRLYPQANEQLLKSIIETGLILSEVPLGQSPARYRFLQRNRLIAVLAYSTVVVEARWRSGALNTANHALELGRPVYAVPGPIFSPSSEGCHRLIRDGLAQLITDASDITTGHLSLDAPEQTSLFEQPDARTQLLDSLTEEQQRTWDSLPLRTYAPIDDINRTCGLPARLLLTVLSQLRTLGLAETNGAGWRKQKTSSRGGAQGR